MSHEGGILLTFFSISVAYNLAFYLYSKVIK